MFRNLIVLTLFLLFGVLSVTSEAAEGVVGKYNSDGFPVIVSFVPDLPESDRRAELPWLTVVSWKYDEKSNNGMPIKNINDQMIRLEEALVDDVAVNGKWRHAYNRTGKGLKEFAFYIDDRDRFIERLNAALSGHPPYPIEITFYNDPGWKDFSDLIEMFQAGK